MIDTELERIKTDINLVELAGSYGYECVRKESSRSSIVMMHSDGSKIVIATATDGHGIFFSVHEKDCSGSVLDFVMHRERASLGTARRILRRYLVPGYLFSHSTVHYRPEAVSGMPDLYARWLGMQPYRDSGYLEHRGLNVETIRLFSDRVRMDERGNVAFRHDDLHSFTGWEMKNKGFTGFSGGGKKALFGCKIGVPDKTPAPLLVVAESAIDALSYYQLQPRPGFYLSFAGAISHDQRELLVWVLNRYPGAKIIIATDNDHQGETYAELIFSIRGDAQRDRPPVGKDWNDTLNNRKALQVMV